MGYDIDQPNPGRGFSASAFRDAMGPGYQIPTLRGPTRAIAPMHGAARIEPRALVRSATAWLAAWLVRRRAALVAPRYVRPLVQPAKSGGETCA